MEGDGEGRERAGEAHPRRRARPYAANGSRRGTRTLTDSVKKRLYVVPQTLDPTPIEPRP